MESYSPKKSSTDDEHVDLLLTSNGEDSTDPGFNEADLVEE